MRETLEITISEYKSIGKKNGDGEMMDSRVTIRVRNCNLAVKLGG